MSNKQLSKDEIELKWMQVCDGKLKLFWIGNMAFIGVIVRGEDKKVEVINCHTIPKVTLFDRLKKLAEKGPDKNVSIEGCKDLIINRNKMAFILDCNEKKWKDFVKKEKTAG